MTKRRSDMKENSNNSLSSSLLATSGLQMNESSNSNTSVHSANGLNPEALNKHEMFLQAFEKPTQIYRYLRTRHTFSPVFLHRTLSYMKHRMSRDNQKRKSFRVDLLLEKVTERKSMDLQPQKKLGNVDIQIAGIFDKNIADNKTVINVSISVIQEHKSGDQNLPSNEIPIGEFRISCNPKENSKSVTNVRLPKEHFAPNGKHLLVFTANLPRQSCGLDALLDGRSADDYPVKRRKGSIEYRKFRAELLLVGKSHEHPLKDGEYHVVLKDYSSRSQTNSVQEKFRKNFCWGQNVELNGNLKELSQDPCISFFFLWCNDSENDTTPPSTKSFHWKNAQPLKQIEPLNGEVRATVKNDLKLHSFHLHTNGLQRRDSTHSNVNGTAVNGVRNGTTPSNKVVYRFVHNNKTLQQTKASSDFRCPWCNIFCFQIASLRQHLRFCHCRLCFNCILDKNGYRIDVTINDNYDGSFCGNAQFKRNHRHSLHSGPIQRTPVTHILINLKGRIRDQLNELLEQETLESELIKPFVYGHNRLYYHSGTCQPIRPHELDVDSEDENDPEWMRIKTQLMIDEFTDVNEGEKEVMKLWNLHMMKHNFVGEIHVPLACNLFVEENWSEIVRSNIYMNFVLHLNNLFDYGVLSSGDLRSVIRRFHQLKQENSKSVEKLCIQQKIR